MASLVPGLEGDTLLEQMNKLFEPPGNQGVDDVGEPHPYFKRPGKGHNHDCCDSCKEGGALVSVYMKTRFLGDQCFINLFRFVAIFALPLFTCSAMTHLYQTLRSQRVTGAVSSAFPSHQIARDLWSKLDVNAPRKAQRQRRPL